ncbi:hypothetical protein NC653_011683 [Populus alba x Populus x berolinensis]|uniref:Uncharacterized protein n=1 Tax=Populus alba x Populus x berolinensis TaxID=444605 RepID=A0AAD6W6V5_9ROSI|nr:hypothetical protein NC653_011683 [Populus alba x Populus x berolinensis]
MQTVSRILKDFKLGFLLSPYPTIQQEPLWQHDEQRGGQALTALNPSTLQRSPKTGCDFRVLLLHADSLL